MSKLIKIPSSAVCTYCQHDPWQGLTGDPEPGVVYSKARAKWLEKAAQMLMDMTGDDDWVDWRDDHYELLADDE